MRAISSVVDVAVFLLLVSVAVATLMLVPDGEPEPVVVDERAELLGSVTADIEYRLHGSQRRAHGTVAALLARGAVANASIDGHPIGSGHDEYLARVHEITHETLGSAKGTQVLVTWSPYRGAPVRGTVRVGVDPPPRTDVSVATLSIPVPVQSPRNRPGSRTQPDGFRAVASTSARTTAEILLPRNRAGLPSGRPSAASVVASSRLRTLAAATGVSVDGPLSRGNVSAARARVVEGLTDRYETDMQQRFETPAEADRARRATVVRVTLRRWDA